ncbi:efflux RND transporter periplasmic adaptor subunit [Chelativorans xinjiangense]|uniref:efflux RND transporter periplasmic adaptor subunit n=1 Tax=Chelativorans xinjiangense TaxID=2681485 RepID=UPI00135829A6|nr:HlyD family efflux transporter periplasmic adaptor subunit [Chelativorans xinjiangense]
MRRIWIKRTAGLLIAAAAVAGVVWFAWPQPIPVDLASIVRAPMEVTIEDEGRTRVRYIYTVSAPIAGKVLRTPRHVGDEVVADETVVAVMQATAPGFLDIRSREELRAALAAAESAVELAEHEMHRIERGLEFARDELQRAETLARRKVVSAQAMEKAQVDVETTEHALASAKAQLAVRRSEHASLAARLMEPRRKADSQDAAWGIQLRAPVSGRVLAIHQESEAVVQPGTPLIDIGDPRDLEVVVNLLSSEAARIEPGATARIDGWGGPPLRGRVRRIDPAGFTKISALGIEEQRVGSIIELVDSPEAWPRLGHDFRVIVNVTVWSSADALAVPVAALFRRGDGWAAYVVREGRARSTTVDIGRRTDRTAEVLAGLSPGEQVILHPSDSIADGVAVAARRER